MKNVSILFACLITAILPLTGCGNQTPVYTALPPPEFAKVPDLVANASCDKDVQKFISAGTSSESAQCDSKGVIKLTTNFKDENSVRSTWDMKLPLDLSKSSGITFDFRADNLSIFSALIVY